MHEPQQEQEQERAEKRQQEVLQTLGSTRVGFLGVSIALNAVDWA